MVYQESRHYDSEYRNWPPDTAVFLIVSSEVLMSLAHTHAQPKPVIARSLAQFSTMACTLNPQFLAQFIYEKLESQLRKLADKSQERADAAAMRATKLDELRGRIRLGFQDPK